MADNTPEHPEIFKPEDHPEVERVAEQVARGTDAIEVPKALMEDQPAAPAEKAAAASSEEQLNRSLWAQIQTMTVAQRVKLAMKGGKDARAILLRANNRMVQRLVLQNPRITEDEILNIAKNRSIDEEILRIVADRREWTASYAIRTALVENAKTPIHQALRLLATLNEKEIRGLAKSKNVPAVISTAARKVIFQKEQARKASH